ncbi:unnamed protein product [Rangifer tarandus platyrhynchus]|uniref:Uncharacterized protein n=1 Tax=Rangifer tarandus platyrhynchus TaxID=3082113 RepID=A0AC59YSA1_RANTA
METFEHVTPRRSSPPHASLLPKAERQHFRTPSRISPVVTSHSSQEAVPLGDFKPRTEHHGEPDGISEARSPCLLFEKYTLGSWRLMWQPTSAGAQAACAPGPAENRGPSRATTPRARPARRPLPGSRAAPPRDHPAPPDPVPGRPLAFPLRLQRHPLQPRLPQSPNPEHRPPPFRATAGDCPSPPQPGCDLARVPGGTESGRGVGAVLVLASHAGRGS